MATTTPKSSSSFVGPPSPRPSHRLPLRLRVLLLLHRNAGVGLWACYAALGGMAAFHAFDWGPPWVGLLAAYLPASIFIAWVTTR